jgi:hypothetical protein
MRCNKGLHLIMLSTRAESVDSKPTTTTTVVDNGTFKTKTEAEVGMKATRICTEN